MSDSERGVSDTAHEPPRSEPGAGGDLRRVRGFTVVTLWALILTSGFTQLVAAVDAPITVRTTLLVIGTVASGLLASACVPLLLRRPQAAPGQALAVGSVAAAAFVWALASVPPFWGWTWALMLATTGGILGCFVHGSARIVVLFGTMGVIAAGGVIGSLGSGTVFSAIDPVLWGLLVLFTLTPLSTVWVFFVVQRLEDARRLATELAVARERLRFATDLHDIQGHNLQVIALKSELAERLLHERPQAAADEIAQIRVIAKTALEDTRAVVNDYRTVTVAVEVRNAAAVLRSADIRCDARVDVPGMPEEIGAVFAVAIREGATNVLRHSTATHASFELVIVDASEYRLTVTNDGVGAVGQGGTGLRGLSERVAAQHGTVQTRRERGSFELVVRVPLSAPAAPSVPPTRSAVAR